MASEIKPTILLIYHDCDLVFYKAFDRLAERGGYRVVVAAPDDARLPDVPHLSRIGTAAIRSKFSIKAHRALRRNIKDTGASIVFCVSTSALANALWAARGTGAAVAGYRGTQARVHRFDPTYRMALLNRRTAAIVCETEDICSYLAAYIPAHKLSWRLKPYMREWIEAQIADPAPLEGSGLQICCVGMMKDRPHKGLRHLIDAMHILNGMGVDCHLTVVGSADDADIAAAPGNVTFTGPRPDAPRFIAAADVLAMPSTRDASPRVVREAQACGKPCVVSDIKGARDLIIASGSRQSGILTTAASPEAFAEALRQLADDRAGREKMGANGIANITENYNLDTYVDYLESVFADLK